MHSSPEFRSLKAKLRVLCKQRRLRLEEFMKTFDVHRVKKIRAEQFVRALDGTGLRLSRDEVELLLAKYRLPTDPSFVDYLRFCDLIDKVFTVKGLGTGTPPEPLALAAPRAFGTAAPSSLLSTSDRERLAAVQTKLLAAVMTKGVVLKDVFRDFDKSNAGKVTRPQFIRDLLDIVVLTQDELDVLLAAYSDALDVHYRVLHYDICPGAAGAGTVAAAPRSPERRHFSAPAASFTTRDDVDAVHELEATLSTLVLRDRIRTKPFFTDFDSLRTGKCSEAQFKRCAKLCFASLSERDLALLTAKYVVQGLDCNKFDYIRFCHTVEGKLRTNDSDSDSNSNNNTRRSDDDDALASIVASTVGAKCSREVRGLLTESEAVLHHAVLQRLAAFCATRRVLLKPSFQDFDKGRREHITVEQFLRVLTVFQLALASGDETRVLLKRYASAHGDRFVNYVTFCYDLEHWLSSSNQGGGSGVGRPLSRGGTNVVSAIPSSAAAPSILLLDTEPLPTRSVPMLLRYVKQVVRRDRIRLEEFYRDFDKLRHGSVTAAQFAAGLSAAGLALSTDEVRLLGDEYASPGGVVDSAGVSVVAWKRFVDDVESVFTVKGLERAPHHDVQALGTRSDQFGGVQIERDELSAADERAVTQTVRAIRRVVDRQRLSIKPAFEDFDRAKQGVVSATKFERVLSMFGLLPPDAVHARLLLRKFCEQVVDSSTVSSSLSALGDVNYRAFLQALDIVGATTTDNTALVLPDSVSFRQAQLNGSVGLDVDTGAKRAARDLEQTASSSFTDVTQLLAELQRQLRTRRVRLKDFVAEGDKLRAGEITIAKFHTALNRSGCVLDAADVRTLSVRFLSAKHPDKIDWRAFLDALDSAAATTDVSSSALERLGGKDDNDKDDNDRNDKDDKAIRRVLERVRLAVSHRRLHLKPYFQDYDRNKISRVTRFQFASVLDLMHLDLLPRDVQALSHHFAVRDGRRVTTDVNYVAFVLAVDADYQ